VGEKQPAIVSTQAREHGGFGGVLRHYRLAAGLTQEALAERAGLSPRTIQHLERGETRPYRDTAQRLGRALELTGEQRARFEAALPPAPRGVRVDREDRRGAPPAGGRPWRARAGERAAPHNLPVQLTEFVGRAEQLPAVQGLLRPGSGGPHLVTLTGPGGSGKTRLALEVAAVLLGEGAFPDGVFVASLASLAEPELVVPAIARLLGVVEARGRAPLAGLQEYLCSRRVLLVLDNMEHLLAAASFAGALLERCAGLRILATSRVPLHLYGERAVPVPPLRCPDPHGAPPLEDLATYEAVRLFVARAQDVEPGFALTPANAGAVAAICARLDGLPLALELAASRCKAFSPSALLARLDRRLPLLAGGPRDVPARHQTLRGALAWSHDLLAPPDQALFRRLGVFAGGCSLDAVGTVCRAAGETDAPAPDAVEGVVTLVDHSLLQRSPGRVADTESRYTMLETIREYALEQLAVSGEGEAVQRAHALYYRRLAEEAAPHLAGAAAATWLARLEADHDNLRAAVEWMMANDTGEQSLRFAAALAPFWSARGYLGEGRARLNAVLALPDAQMETAARGALLRQAAKLAREQGDLAAARPLLEESLEIARRARDRRGMAHALLELADNAHNRGENVAARGLALESLGLWREVGDAWGTAEALWLLGYIGFHEGDRAAAGTLMEEGLNLYRAAGDRVGEAFCLGYLGHLATDAGDYARAHALLDSAFRIVDETGERWVRYAVLHLLIRLALAKGDVTTARALLAELLAFIRDAGMVGEVPAGALLLCAGLAVAQGRDERALRLSAAAEVLGGPVPELDYLRRTMVAPALERATAPLSAAARARAIAAGQTMTLAEALTEALDEVAEEPQS
jgi:predicted ATPase/transcriptional regulator with XRE-family HTH domain